MIKIKYQKPFIKEFKKLRGKLKNQYSFRVTWEYRVIFEFIEKEVVGFIAVKHRKDTYWD